MVYGWGEYERDGLLQAFFLLLLIYVQMYVHFPVF